MWVCLCLLLSSHCLHVHTHTCPDHSLSYSAFILFYFPLDKPPKLSKLKITWLTVLPLLLPLISSFPVFHLHFAFLCLHLSHEQSYILGKACMKLNLFEESCQSEPFCSSECYVQVVYLNMKLKEETKLAYKYVFHFKVCHRSV